MLDVKLESISHSILAADFVLFIGMGTSGSICRYAARYFSSMGVFSLYLDDPFFPINNLQQEKKNTVILAISSTGETSEVISMVESYKDKNRTLISITNSSNNTLAKLSDYNLNYFMDMEYLGYSRVTTAVPVIFYVELLAKKINYILSESKKN